MSPFSKLSLTMSKVLKTAFFIVITLKLVFAIRVMNFQSNNFYSNSSHAKIVLPQDLTDFTLCFRVKLRFYRTDGSGANYFFTVASKSDNNTDYFKSGFRNPDTFEDKEVKGAIFFAHTETNRR